jgi:hypothetical protein
MMLFDWLQIVAGVRYCVRRALAAAVRLRAAKPQKRLAIAEPAEGAESSP